MPPRLRHERSTNPRLAAPQAATPRPRTTASRYGSVVEIGLKMDTALRLALRVGLDRFLAEAPGGPWRVRLSGALVYRTAIGEWWWKLTVASASAGSRAFLVAPEQQEKAFLLALITSVVRGRVHTGNCVGCGRLLAPGAPARPAPKGIREVCKTCSHRRPTRLEMP